MIEREFLKKVRELIKNKKMIDGEYIEKEELDELDQLEKKATRMLSDSEDIQRRYLHYTIDIETDYCETSDKTFISRNIFGSNDNLCANLLSSEVIGWYCGEPNDKDTLTYADGHLKAEYTM